MKIGLISDTHGYVDPRIGQIFADCDEIWHAGDFGTLAVADALNQIQTLRGVHGNIDGPELRDRFPQDQRFSCAGLDVWMTHIGGHPGRYDRSVRSRLQADPPGLFICGHSHQLNVQRDKSLGLVHLNPGAAGHHGFHTLRTMMLLVVEKGTLVRVQAVDLGPRGRRTSPREQP